MNFIKRMLLLIAMANSVTATLAQTPLAVTLRENYLVSLRVVKNGEDVSSDEMPVITGTPQFHSESIPADGKGMWMDLTGSLRPTGSNKVMLDYTLRTTTTGQPPPDGETAPGAQSLMKLDLGEEYPVFRSGDLVYMLSVCVYRKARTK